MGCGASFIAPVPATPEQKTEICAVFAKEMMRLIANKALSNTDSIVCLPPDEVQEMRKQAKNMRDAAKDVKGYKDGSEEDAKKAGALLEAPAEEKPKAGGVGGFLSSAVSAASGLASKATELIQGGFGAVMEKLLLTTADQIDKACAALEKPFETVGKDIMEEKKEQITNALKMFIGNAALSAGGMATTMVRGTEPHELDQYSAAPTDGCTEWLCRKSRKNLVAQLLPVCEEAIKKHTVCTAWDSAIVNWNSCVKSIMEFDWCRKNIPLETIDVNISEHIVGKCIDSLAELMAKEEEALRKNAGAYPDPSSKKPEWLKVYKVVWTGEPLTDQTYAQFKNGTAV